jgi:hypothetical protein
MEKRDYSRVWLEREKEEKKKRARAIRKAKKVAQALKKKYGVEESISSAPLFGGRISCGPARISTCSSKGWRMKNTSRFWPIFPTFLMLSESI